MLLRVLTLLYFAVVPAAQAVQVPQSEVPVVVASDADPQIAALVKARKWKDLLSLTADLHRRTPLDPIFAYWLGVAHLQLHTPVDAVRAFRSAEKAGLNTPILHEDLGLAYYDLNQFTLFEQQMQKAAKLDPRNPAPPYYLGLYRWTIRGDVAGALNYFDSAVQLDPGDWKSLYQAGNCQEQLGNLNEARKQYEAAIGIVQKNGAPFGWPYQGMARLTITENPQGALAFAQDAVRLEPEEPSNHVVLASVFEQLGRLAEATHEAEIAASQSPNDSRIRYSLYKLYRRTSNPKATAELELFEKLKALYDKD